MRYTAYVGPNKQNTCCSLGTLCYTLTCISDHTISNTLLIEGGMFLFVFAVMRFETTRHILMKYMYMYDCI